MPTDKRPLKVFLCHAHADRDAVRALYARLTNDGVDAWLDKEKLLGGQNWRMEIQTAVEEADVVVVCHSKEFNKEGFRQREVKWAIDVAMEKPEGEIYIIPARLEECEVIKSLRDWHWVDLFEEDGYEKLARALQKRADTIGVSVENNDIKNEKRHFYDLILHYEYDLEDADASVVAKYLLELLVRNPISVSMPSKYNENYIVEHRTRTVEYFNPKDGQTIQHALIIRGTISVFSDEGQYRSVKSVDSIPEMLIVTIIQGVRKSKIRFDSDDLEATVFKAFVDKFLYDLVG